MVLPETGNPSIKRFSSCFIWFGPTLQPVFVQGTHTHQFQVSPYQVKQHRKFIDPQFSHNPSDLRYAEIIGEFSSILQSVFPVDIILQVFGVRMHGPHFIHTDDPSPLANPGQLHNNPLSRIVRE